jgi:predicted nucleotidyltransferase
VAVATEEAILAAAQRLSEAASSRPARVILFGSYARGQAREDSDIDFLVVEPRVAARRAEIVRLRCALLDLDVPIDVLVASEAQLDDWSSIPGTVFHEAVTRGRVLVDLHRGGPAGGESAGAS